MCTTVHFMHLSSVRPRRTHRGLAEATYEIVRTQGPDHLTAEAVATMAGVSRRTFFNYFPSIDAACAHSVELLLAELTETLSRRPADECLWDTMEALLAGEAGSPVIERLALLAATKENSPVAATWPTITSTLRRMAHWVAHGPSRPGRRRGVCRDSRRPVVATAEATVHIWQRRRGRATTPAALTAYHDLLTTRWRGCAPASTSTRQLIALIPFQENDFPWLPSSTASAMVRRPRQDRHRCLADRARRPSGGAATFGASPTPEVTIPGSSTRCARPHNHPDSRVAGGFGTVVALARRSLHRHPEGRPDPHLR